MSASLQDQLKSDMIAAMKAKQKERLSVIRMLLAAVKDAAIEKQSELSDEEVQRILASYAKKRQEGVTQMEELGREDLAAKERAELEICRAYLPEQLSDDELAALVTAVIDELGAGSMRDMGAVMKLCKERVDGRADGSRISALVKAKLSS